MKTSFYFVLWICIYPILELTGVSFLQENSFFVALLIVMFAVPHLTKKIFEKDIIYTHNKRVIDYFETIYTNNVAKIKKGLMTNIILNSVVFIYFCVVCGGNTRDRGARCIVAIYSVWRVVVACR